LYDELLPNFRSRKFNVGCDETWGIEPRDYLAFLLQIHKLVTARGHTMHLWGDIVLQHPELVSELPRDVVVLDWGYEAASPFDKHGELLAATGLAHFVCPGTSSWNSLGGRTDNCFANLRNAAVHGLKHGATGYLNADWGDNGHWQYWPVSLPGVAAGAAMSWCAASNDDPSIRAGLGAHVFRNPVASPAVLDLGNAYLHTGHILGNSTALFHLLQRPAGHAVFDVMEPKKLEQTREFIGETAGKLASLEPALMRDEFANTVRMMTAACDRGLRRLGRETMAKIVSEHRRLWLARNRPGGLDASCRVLEQRVAELP
jgi:hypothetical protein